MKLRVTIGKIGVTSGPGIRGCASRLVQCIDHFRLILFCIKLSIGIYMAVPICSVNLRPTLVLK